MQAINSISINQLCRIVNDNKKKESIKLMQEIVEEVKNEATK
jgi:hypothetical protein